MTLQHAINSSAVRHGVSAEFIIARWYGLLYVGTEGHVLRHYTVMCICVQGEILLHLLVCVIFFSKVAQIVENVLKICNVYK
jgi:hypothetical protein